MINLTSNINEITSALDYKSKRFSVDIENAKNAGGHEGSCVVADMLTDEKRKTDEFLKNLNEQIEKGNYNLVLLTDKELDKLCDSEDDC